MSKPVASVRPIAADGFFTSGLGRGTAGQRRDPSPLGSLWVAKCRALRSPRNLSAILRARPVSREYSLICSLRGRCRGSDVNSGKVWGRRELVEEFIVFGHALLGMVGGGGFSFRFRLGQLSHQRVGIGNAWNLAGSTRCFR